MGSIEIIEMYIVGSYLLTFIQHLLIHKIIRLSTNLIAFIFVYFAVFSGK